MYFFLYVHPCKIVASNLMLVFKLSHQKRTKRSGFSNIRRENPNKNRHFVFIFTSQKFIYWNLVFTQSFPPLLTDPADMKLFTWKWDSLSTNIGSVLSFPWLRKLSALSSFLKETETVCFLKNFPSLSLSFGIYGGVMKDFFSIARATKERGMSPLFSYFNFFFNLLLISNSLW